MSIPQKGSRTITVDGICYRWRIRHKPTYSEGAFASHFTVAVERVGTLAGCVLLLAATSPRLDNWLGQPSESVTPSRVAASITNALAAGWQPEQRGPGFAHPLHPSQAASLA